MATAHEDELCRQLEDEVLFDDAVIEKLGSEVREWVTRVDGLVRERDRLQAQYDSLYLAVEGEVERRRDRAADSRDRAMAARTRPVGQAYLRDAEAVDADTDRLQAILDTAGEKREVPDRATKTVVRCDSCGRNQRTTDPAWLKRSAEVWCPGCVAQIDGKPLSSEQKEADK